MKQNNKICVVAIVSMFLLTSIGAFTATALKESNASDESMSALNEWPDATIVINYFADDGELRVKIEQFNINEKDFGTFTVKVHAMVNDAGPKGCSYNLIMYEDCMPIYPEIGFNKYMNESGGYVETYTFTLSEDINNKYLEIYASIEISDDESISDIRSTSWTKKSREFNPIFNNVLARLLKNYPNMLPIIRAILKL